MKKATPLAMTALVVGANLPDVDGILYLFDDLRALEFRRGWTHGVLAMAVLPPALAGTLLAWDRLVRRKRAGAGPPARFTPLLLVSLLSILSHPLLDFLNTYGVRFGMPFSGRWFYGDTLYIVDPWISLALGAGIVMSSRRDRRGRARPRAPARAAIAACLAYALVMFGAGRVGRAAVADRARRLELPLAAQMVGPVELDPFRRSLVLDLGGEYRFGVWRWFPSPSLALSEESHPDGADHPWARAAASTAAGRAFLSWSRFPLFSVERSPAGDVVEIRDARYGGRRGSWAAVRIPLPSRSVAR